MALLTKQEIIAAADEDWLARLDRMAKNGDPDAGRTLHALLAAKLGDAAGGDGISPSVANLLQAMHAAFARGESAIEAMHLGKPQGGSPLILQRERVFGFVADMMANRDYVDANRARLKAKGIRLPVKPSKNEIYRRAAKALGMGDSTVKNMYLAERKRIAKESEKQD